MEIFKGLNENTGFMKVFLGPLTTSLRSKSTGIIVAAKSSTRTQPCQLKGTQLNIAPIHWKGKIHAGEAAAAGRIHCQQSHDGADRHHGLVAYRAELRLSGE